MFEKLPKLPKGKGKKKRNTFKKLEPVYIKKLANDGNLFHRKIGDMCGVSEATISTAIRENAVYYPIEKAAELAWKETFEEDMAAPAGEVFVAMMIKESAFDLLRPWLKQAGAVLKTIK